MSRFISDDTMFSGHPFLEDNGIEFAHDAPMRHRHHHGPVPPHGWPPHRPVFIYGNGASSGALAYKGTVSSESDLLHVRLNKGECYIVSVAGEYAGQQCDVGDLIIVNASGTYVTSDELAAAISSLQSNVDMSDYVADADLPGKVGQIIQAGSHISIAQNEGHSIVSAVTSPISDDASGLAIAGDVYDAIMDVIGGGGSIVNTTYTLSKSGNTITLTGSDGSSYDVVDSDTNTTYSLSKSGSTIRLVGSDGQSNSVTDSDTTYSLSKSGDDISLVGSDGSRYTVTTPDSEVETLRSQLANVQSQLSSMQSSISSINSRLSVIGEEYHASGNYSITAADVTSLKNGPHITVPAGVYIFVGSWTFNSGSDAGDRNMQVGFHTGDNNLWGERVRIRQSDKNFNVLNVCALRGLDAQTTVYLAGSASIKSGSAEAYITARRLA